MVKCLFGTEFCVNFACMKVLLRDDIEQISEETVQELLLQLPQWRREAMLRFKHLAGRREGAAAFLLLQQALREECGLTEVPPFSYTEHGKPFLQDYPHIHFNLSHCRTAVLCALSDRPVGVDVERIRTARPDLVRYTMNTDEQRQIFSSVQPDLEFTRLWTRKEAVVKLTGEGVGNAMHDLLLPAHLQQLGVQLTTTDGEGYVYTVATQL